MRYFRWAIRIFLFVWELPQNLLGIGALLYDRVIGYIVEIRFERERVMIETRRRAVSLGLFVFWTRQSSHWIELDERNKNHEWGQRPTMDRLLRRLSRKLGGSAWGS